MSITHQPLHSDFGIEIQGIELAAAGDSTFHEIELAGERHSLLLLRGQHLDDDKQLALTRRFGALEFAHLAYARDGSIEYIGHIGNVDKAGRHLGASHPDVAFGAGNYLWHSDSSFRPAPAKYSLSYAYEVTPEGGELEFVSTRAAYKRLPAATKTLLEGQVGIHDYVYSRSQAAEVPANVAATLPPVRQRLVRTNPATGGKNYYVGSHLKTIAGWKPSEARALIDALIAGATRDPDIFRHRWEAGDLLIWDNRCLLHRGRAYDADQYRRRMHQTRVAGVPTLEEPV